LEDSTTSTNKILSCKSHCNIAIYAEDMAMEMLATTLGLPNLVPSLTWNQREEQWKLSGKIYKTQNITQSAQGNKDGLWTTVVSAAILIV